MLGLDERLRRVQFKRQRAVLRSRRGSPPLRLALAPRASRAQPQAPPRFPPVPRRRRPPLPRQRHRNPSLANAQVCERLPGASVDDEDQRTTQRMRR
mmetsp:Transcript_14010/g.46742  ORF Transcript_14010/g.46742 Transcript_14010/m.46742 type:complete len:97 (+) Transcript_14010:89-379(+)